MKAGWIGALVLVILATAVSAQFVEDFSVAAEPSFSTFQGASADSYFQVTNTGSVASGYSVAVVDSDAARWVQMGPLSFTLQPGQSQIVLLHLAVPQDTEPDTYELETVFTTTLGMTASVVQDITVDVPQNVLLQAIPAKTISPCGTASYPLTVINTGTFAEEYDLTVSKNVAPIATFTKDHFTLGAGKNESTTLTLTPKDCAKAGDTAFTVTGVAKSTESKTTLDLTLSVENTFIPKLEAANKRVNTDANTLNATITNTGVKKTTYTLGVTGADFVSVSPNSITVEPGQTGTIEISSKPKSDVAQQPYPLILTASVDDIKYSVPFTLTVKNPTWVELHLWFLFKMVIFAIILIIIAVVAIGRWVAYTETPAYQEKKAERDKLRAEQQAAREKEAAKAAKEREKLRAEKLEQKELDRKQRAQEKLEARLAKERNKGAKEAAAELKATHVLISREKLQGEAIARRSNAFWWIALIILILAAGVLLYGFRTYLLANRDAVITGGIALLIVIILLIVYRVFFSAKSATQEWVALKPRRENQLETGWRAGLGQLWIRVTELIPNAKLTVMGTRRNPTFIAPEGAVYQYLTIAPEGVTADQVEKQRFMFRVARSWLERHEIAEGGIKLMRYTADGWRGIGTEKVRSDEKWVYYQASAVGFEPYAIVGKSRVKREPVTGIAPGWWFLILGIIVVAAVLGGIYYLALAGKTGTEIVGAPTASGIPLQAWDEDTAHTIDLGTYFRDPDGDPLTYSYTPVANIVVTISGNTATLTPEKDWFGERTITFTADDGKGGKVNSNAVKLIVRDVPEPTFWANARAGFERYAGYVVAGIILLVILIVLLEYRKTFSK
ncbi:MAG TPA: PGF-pre-PGF domain-containing protein [Candidatus Binatia bacterium]|nr:PGF-pre-PGF domain-containing protein [Candidatus Binatia bacterium]